MKTYTYSMYIPTGTICTYNKLKERGFVIIFPIIYVGRPDMVPTYRVLRDPAKV